MFKSSETNVVRRLQKQMMFLAVHHSCNFRLKLLHRSPLGTMLARRRKTYFVLGSNLGQRRVCIKNEASSLHCAQEHNQLEMDAVADTASTTLFAKWRRVCPLFDLLHLSPVCAIKYLPSLRAGITMLQQNRTSAENSATTCNSSLCRKGCWHMPPVHCILFQIGVSTYGFSREIKSKYLTKWI